MKFISNLKYKLSVALFSTLGFFTINQTFANEEASTCAPFQMYLELIKHTPEEIPGNLEVIQFNIDLREHLRISAENIWALYIKGEHQEGVIEKCIKSKVDLEIFYQNISDVFLERSLQFLENSKTPTLIELVENIRKTQFDMGMLLYRLLSHDQSTEEREKQGGYHRGKRSLFMNFEKIPSRDWFVIFIHEIAHVQDSILWSASEDYSNESLSQEVAKICHSYKKLEQLNAQEKQKINDYFCSGYHRGLLAEVRAWTLTFRGYREGLESGVFKNIEWMDVLLQKVDLKNEDTLETEEQKVIQYLSPRFFDPTDGVYSLDVSQEALREIRNKYLEGKKSAFQYK